MNEKAKAKSNLIWYMEKAWKGAGLSWDMDNDAEVGAIIDYIIGETDKRIKTAIEQHTGKCHD